MNRMIAATILTVLLLLPVPTNAEPSETPVPQTSDASIADGVSAWLGKLDFSSWEDTFNALPDEVRELWSDVDVDSMIREYAETGTGASDGILVSVLSGLMKDELRRGSLTFAVLLGFCVLSGIVGALSSKGEGAGEAAGFVCRCFALTFVLTSFASMTGVCLDCIALLSRFMQLALPALLTLLTAIGGVTATGVFQPATVVLCGTVTGLMQTAVIPLSVIGGTFALLDRLTDRVRIGELSNLFKKLAKWLIGVISTVYVGATAIRGMAASAYDGITVRTAKYAASSLVPMVGGMVSGTMDTVLGCAALVKNAAGVTAILLAVSIAVTPLIRLAAGMLLFRASAAVGQPIADGRLPGMYHAAADMYSYLFAAMASVALMFILTVALITGLGNAGYLG